MSTVSDAIIEASRVLEESSVEDPRRTASLLMRHVLGCDQARLVMRSTEPLIRERREEYFDLVRRRAGGEPTQYITGHQEFFGLDFTVTPDVLIPRPETESLVEQVIRIAAKIADRTPLIADVGTGSGCIAIALAANIQNARIVAVDLSAAALAIARKNAERHGVAGLIKFEEGDLIEPLKRFGGELFDIIAANPPYVPSTNPSLIAREVREHEPALALFGGIDGLDSLRRLLRDAPAVLKPGGHMVVEIGYNQIDAMTKLLDPEYWELIEVINDLQVIPRTLILRRR